MRAPNACAGETKPLALQLPAQNAPYRFRAEHAGLRVGRIAAQNHADGVRRCRGRDMTACSG